MEGEVKHGTAYTYKKGCRCEECKTGQATRALSWRNKQRGLADSDGIPKYKHGKVTTYNVLGCRCKACHKARLKSLLGKDYIDFDLFRKILCVTLAQKANMPATLIAEYFDKAIKESKKGKDNED